MKRTSLTHPLQIAVVSAGPDFGRVGITFCPGILEPKELTLLRVERLGEEVARRNMLWFHLPIVDVSIPDQRFEENWNAAGEELRSILRNGSDVLVHCRGGLGRAGTIASRLLIELGMRPKTSIERVRAVRPWALET